MKNILVWGYSHKDSYSDYLDCFNYITKAGYRINGYYYSSIIEMPEWSIFFYSRLPIFNQKFDFVLYYDGEYLVDLLSEGGICISHSNNVDIEDLIDAIIKYPYYKNIDIYKEAKKIHDNRLCSFNTIHKNSGRYPWKESKHEDVLDTMRYSLLNNEIQNKDEIKSFINKTFGSGLVIKNVIFNEPATILFWSDGTKTVVKCQNGDIFDPEKGIAMAYMKKAFGGNGSYNDEIHKWTAKYYAKKYMPSPEVKYEDNSKTLKDTDIYPSYKLDF